MIFISIENFEPSGPLIFSWDLQGGTKANVLVGIQVSETEMGEFRDRANKLGYEYEIESRNEAFQLLMR